MREFEKGVPPSLLEICRTFSARTEDRRFWPSKAATSRDSQSAKGYGRSRRLLKAQLGLIVPPRLPVLLDSSIPRPEPDRGQAPDAGGPRQLRPKRPRSGPVPAPVRRQAAGVH